MFLRVDVIGVPHPPDRSIMEVMPSGAIDASISAPAFPTTDSRRRR
jgi:hypothetical protein